MALDLTCFTTRQANTSACFSISVGCRSVTHFHSSGLVASVSGVWTSKPPPILLSSRPRSSPAVVDISRSRRLFLAARGRRTPPAFRPQERLGAPLAGGASRRSEVPGPSGIEGEGRLKMSHPPFSGGGG